MDREVRGRYDLHMRLTIEVEQEDDGRWIAEIRELPGVMVYGVTPLDAEESVKVLALRVIAERLEHGERLQENKIEFCAAA